MATGGVAVTKIHPDSNDTYESVFDLFQTPASRTSRLGSRFIRVKPDRNPPGDVIEHTVPASKNEYTDASECYYLADIKVSESDGDALPGVASNLEVWPTNNFVHTLFETMKVELNDKTLSYNGNYGVDAYINMLVSEDINAKNGRLTAAG